MWFKRSLTRADSNRTSGKLQIYTVSESCYNGLCLFWADRPHPIKYVRWRETCKHFKWPVSYFRCEGISDLKAKHTRFPAGRSVVTQEEPDLRPLWPPSLKNIQHPFIFTYRPLCRLNIKNKAQIWEGNNKLHHEALNKSDQGYRLG